MRVQPRTIGRLAQEAAVTVETIRFYERRGLLRQPSRPREGGYRHYDDDAVRLLRYVRLAQDLGLTLKEIEHLLQRSRETQNTFCKAMRETIEVKLAAARAELAALRRLEKKLQAFLTICAARSQDLPCPILAGLGHLPNPNVSESR